MPGFEGIISFIFGGKNAVRFIADGVCRCLKLGDAQSKPLADEPGCDGTLQDGELYVTTFIEPKKISMPLGYSPSCVDKRDQGTPDDWVKRHPEMVRLTGNHPFNSEPPMPLLQQVGWVTPPTLFVVRNHGAVPKFSWESHRLKVTGVPQSRDFSMDELASGRVGEVVSIPVTFICSGNRRKEENMVKKTIGFNWGPAGVGNSVWTGVRLCDLLAYVGVSRPSKAHQYVHFEGPDGELPKGETGSYATSITIAWALDKERDVMLAFKQNGEWLLPDHGFPLRNVLPGATGARMIKWLSRIIVSDKPSTNHYHFYDNRVLPPHADSDIATQEGWWFQPENLITHMNVNSAMFEPRHNSFYTLQPNTSVKVSGYAYSGSGNRVTRVDISLDEGKSWEMAELVRPEDEIAAARGTDKHWCWAWWSTHIPSERLQHCTEIMCRAQDSAHNLQPLHLTWNVMGMMNNCVFRVKVHSLEQNADKSTVWFEHPTMPGANKGGWMTPEAGQYDAALATAASYSTDPVPKRDVVAIWNPSAKEKEVAGPRKSSSERQGRQITAKEVALHNSKDSAWIVVNGNVYDCTTYLKDHPGGASSIMLVAGQEDSTEDFQAVHSQKAWDLLDTYYIGSLQTGELSAPAQLAKTLQLKEKIQVSHDTRIFRFYRPSWLSIPTGMHIMLIATVDGKKVMRPYTPLSDEHDEEHVDLLVKVYFAGVHPKFPNGGLMSQYLESMTIGQTIKVKGPLGEIEYKGKGAYNYQEEPRSCKFMSFIVGGTGITPAWQVINAVLRDPEDQTQLRLVYANRSPADILLRQELDDMAAHHKDRFQCWYTVDVLTDNDAGWEFDVGFISKDMLEKHIFLPKCGDAVVGMCGPPIMIEKCCIPHLKALDYSEDAYFQF